MLSLIGTAKLNDIDPQAWLADVLAQIADIPQSRLHELLPWNWCATDDQRQAARSAVLTGCIHISRMGSIME
jgi:transposase